MSAERPTPRGLPGPLPEGERILWQGSPDWRALARRAFHGREIAAWFAALAAWRFAIGFPDGWAAALNGAVLTLPAAAIALGLIALLAWGTARCSTYTITDRRVAMRIGIALTANVNLPFGRIDSADLRTYGAVGDISLRLGGGTRLAYGTLWPHARPWRLKKPEPTLRAIPDPEGVAALLAEALQPGGAARVAQATAAAQAAPMPAHGPAALAS